MKRKKVNFRKSASKFNSNAKKILKKNTPSYRASRGGIRL